MFETSLRDERYLPFENSGVISEWQLALPANPSKDEPSQFDYNTISDVILHLRYTAREGGDLLRNAALVQVKELLKETEAVGTVRLFSVRHEFPTEWVKFKNPGSNQPAELTLDWRVEHYPFWSAGHLKKVNSVTILARTTGDVSSIKIADKSDATDSDKDTLEKDPSFGRLLFRKLDKVAFPQTPVGELKLFFDGDVNAVSDLWIAVAWSA